MINKINTVFIESNRSQPLVLFGSVFVSHGEVVFGHTGNGSISFLNARFRSKLGDSDYNFQWVKWYYG